MSDTFDDVYMGTALLHAKKSKAVRAKVGAVLVTKTGIIIPGYNGTPSGTDNACEYQEDAGLLGSRLVTKPEVLHAELNTIMKAAREGVSVLDSTVYVTLSPCLPCAAMLLQAGISRLIYKDKYRDNSGVEYLQKYGIECRQM